MNKIELKDLNELKAGYVLEVINHKYNDETQWFMVHELDDGIIAISTYDGEHYVTLPWVKLTDDFKLTDGGWNVTIIKVYSKCRSAMFAYDVSDRHRNVLWDIDEVEKEKVAKTIDEGDIVRIIGNNPVEGCSEHEFAMGTICVVEIDEFNIDGTYLVRRVNGAEDWWVHHTNIELV